MTQRDQRQSPRSALKTTVEVVDIESGIGFQAKAVDVCDGGISFQAPMEPALGADMYVTVAGASPAPFKVLRINPNEAGFNVAGKTADPLTIRPGGAL